MTGINISAAEVTNLFLYGQSTTPSDLTNPTVATPGAAQPSMTFDINQYMTDGAGRFGKPTQFALVRWFMDNAPSQAPGAETRVSLAELAGVTGLPLIERVTQALYDDGQDSLVERTYIWNTTHFELVNATFVTGADGSRWIENLQIKPQNEDFDFVGGWISELANSVLGIEIRVDPWGIGETINMSYQGSPFTYGNYTKAQYDADAEYISVSYSPISNFTNAITSSLVQDLFDSGTTRFIDGDGKAVIFGQNISTAIDVDSITGAMNDRSGDYAFVTNRAPLLAEAATTNGIHWVGGSGVDKVMAGSKDDILKGFAGDDRLDGREGADSIHGGDGNDVLIGGSGFDQLYGENGADIIVSGSPDIAFESASTTSEIVDGGADTDYVVLSSTNGGHIVVNGGDTADRLLVHTKIFGDVTGDGPAADTVLFALQGGVDGYVYNYPGEGTGLPPYDPDSNVETDSATGQSYRYYFYEDRPYGGPSSLGTSGETPRVEYRHFESAMRLEIIIGDASIGDTVLTISINDFQMGDYGINLTGPLFLPRYYQPTMPLSSLSEAYREAVIAWNEAVATMSANVNAFSLESMGGVAALRAELAAASLAVTTETDVLMIGITGSTNNDNMTGNNVSEIIRGNEGHDVLSGMGGQDQIQGGLGNDNLNGGLGDDVLEGGAGNDILNGAAGNDQMTGGLGNDRFFVNSAKDVVLELVAEGTDTIQSSVTIAALAANVENLILSGTGSISGTGNALDNTITGNAGNNTLNGAEGVDTIVGGLGNDIYTVDTTTDVIVEDLDAGTDTIQSSVSITALTDNVERLTLTGTGNINGTGNVLANLVTGNAGNNILNGGAGHDVLTGGAGRDIFMFNAVLNAATNIDTITDFVAVDDTIRLQNTGAGRFTALADGVLSAAAFVSNATGVAGDADDRIIYKSGTGELFYDADGTGVIAAVQFATLTGAPVITAADFVVI